MLFYCSISWTFWRDRVVKDAINKFDGLNSIIKLSSNNLIHNWMFGITYKLRKITPFAIFYFNCRPLPMIDWPILVLNWIWCKNQPLYRDAILIECQKRKESI